jgi:hypothetical protein
MRFNYVNMKKAFPKYGGQRSWFSIMRRWSGNLIYVDIKHHHFTLDFRSNVIQDMLNPHASDPSAPE